MCQTMKRPPLPLPLILNDVPAPSGGLSPPVGSFYPLRPLPPVCGRVCAYIRGRGYARGYGDPTEGELRRCGPVPLMGIAVSASMVYNTDSA